MRRLQVTPKSHSPAAFAAFGKNLQLHCRNQMRLAVLVVESDVDAGFRHSIARIKFVLLFDERRSHTTP